MQYAFVQRELNRPRGCVRSNGASMAARAVHLRDFRLELPRIMIAMAHELSLPLHHTRAFCPRAIPSSAEQASKPAVSLPLASQLRRALPICISERWTGREVREVQRRNLSSAPILVNPRPSSPPSHPLPSATPLSSCQRERYISSRPRPGHATVGSALSPPLGPSRHHHHLLLRFHPP